MIQGGDEFARTQHGNNNAYCQDNETSWFDWTLVARNQDLVDFFAAMIAFTQRFPVLQQRKFFLGKDLSSDGIDDLTWFAPDLSPPDWNNADRRTLCYQLDAAEDRANVGASRLYVILNGDCESHRITLPPPPNGSAWLRAIDTSLPAGQECAQAGAEVPIEPAGHYIANPRSTVVLLAR
jgi:glycogen operon protein